MRQCKINFIEREKIIKKYKDGVSTIDLANEYGCERSTIYYIVNQAKVVRPNPRFDSSLADTLRKEYEAGATTHELAQRYNTTRQRVSRYIQEAGGTMRSRGPRVAS